MPIHLNLLAEAKIAEDLRRRDPVKRAIYFGAILVVLGLVWSSSLQLEVVIYKNDLNQVQASIDGHTTEWQAVVNSQQKISGMRSKLAALQQLSAARFLQGSFLNALQQLDMSGVELARVRVDQSYFNTPSSATEKIVLTLDARDVSATPGDQVNKFKEVVANQAYFKNILMQTNGVQLTSLSPQQFGPDGKQCVLFTLECDLPQQTR
jgi:hypothetical protein